MHKPELLVPAGDMNCLRQAIFNGCDAVYLAGLKFGARKYAPNFTETEIVKAIKLCHLYGVKIYVTMNTLIKNDEVEEFIEQVDFLYKNGVDALIMQDFGMICYVRELFPNLEIHASTQANISFKEVCQLYYDLGVKRVVLARELSLDEIKDIDVPIEKEVFIHGALCISYSGRCLMSSMLGSRSGNRGECVGCCRMPFTLIENNKEIIKNKYLLSTKELNTTTKINDLINSNIDSLKIEGRMKSSIYVGFITRLYRHLLDGEKLDLVKENNNLKTIYNREFTLGRLFNTNDKDLMNQKFSNHQGLAIGKVCGFIDDKVKIKISKGECLNQYDAIRFPNSKEGFIVNYLYDSNMNLINSCDTECYVQKKGFIKDNDVVLKTQDYKLNKSYEELPKRMILITITVKAILGKELIVIFSDGVNTIKKRGPIVEKSLNSPLEESSIIKHLSKLGNTPFIVNKYNIEKDNNIFIPVSSLNNIRRELVEELINKRENKSNNYLRKEVRFKKDNKKVNNCLISCLVHNEEQLNTTLKLNIKRIYVTNKELFDKYHNNPEVYYVDENNQINSKPRVLDTSYLGHEVAGYSLNVTNIYTAYYLSKIGYKIINLSVELKEDEINDFISKYQSMFGNNNFEVLTYGYIENMIIKGNILNISKDNNYLLKDYQNRLFPVYYDGIKTHILNYEKRVFSTNNNNYTKRIDFLNESSSEVEKIVKQIQ